MKKIKLICFIIPIIYCVYVCCNQISNYDRGYDDAWNESSNALLLFIDKEYTQGYEDGCDDLYYYHRGYGDAFDKKRPTYPGKKIYMEGYRDGKIDR